MTPPDRSQSADGKKAKAPRKGGRGGRRRTTSEDTRTRKPPRQRVKWTENEADILVAGFKQHGKEWARIVADPSFDLPGRTNIDLKDKWKNLEKKHGPRFWEEGEDSDE